MAALQIIEEGIYLLLQQNADLVALCTLKGICLNAVPENAPDPSMCFSTISATPIATNNGPSGLNFRRYQFETFGSTYVKAKQLQTLIRLAIDGFSGTAPNGQRVYNIIRDNELDGYDDVTGEHRTITDYFIHFAE